MEQRIVPATVILLICTHVYMIYNVNIHTNEGHLIHSERSELSLDLVVCDVGLFG